MDKYLAFVGGDEIEGVTRDQGGKLGVLFLRQS